MRTVGSRYKYPLTGFGVENGKLSEIEVQLLENEVLLGPHGFAFFSE
jgi:hypothetical protein